MRLVIAEKPSVAQSIAAVLNAKKRHDGYLEGSGYLVSWCFGHLAELADAAAYNADYAKWTMKDLPIVPMNYRFTIREDKRKQFDILSGLLRREDVSEVVNACDAGREGELIFRTVYCLAGCSKPILRLWISSMEDDAIHAGFKQLKSGRDYDGLHQSALCRAKADWLVGINATRYFSLTYGRTLNIGRVMSPTLALLVQREADISAFVPEPFYTVQLDCGFIAATDRMKDRKTADGIANACKGKTAIVKSVERKEKAEKAPALYDLTALQRDANRILGYTAQQTLDYLQSLYEKKLCTYPRTDSRFLTEDMEDSISGLVSSAAAVCGVASPTTIHAKQVCNNKKVTDHHAIVPTVSAGKTDLMSLPLGEREVLKLAAKGLLRAISEAHRYAETVITVECAGHSFTAKGKTVLVTGWKSYEQEQMEAASTLPDVAEHQPISVSDAAVKTGKTTPPKHFTEDTLLSAMESAGKEDMPDDAERKGIGTPATRSGIIEKLVSSGFVERKKSKKVVNLLPTSTGTALITVLPEQLQSPQLTAEWEHRLKEIERGEIVPDSFMDGITAMLGELMQTYKPIPGAEVLFPSGREIVGKCPRCKADVTETPKGFFCENRACSFALWKNSKFFTAKKKTLTKTLAATLLKDGRAPLKGCYSEKTGKTYDTVILLEDDGQRVSYKMVFGNG
ncbi:MAG: DNA topoisomerase 3 [Oscillospiraceae bacterium]|nr:DNA topoisomerase 3 [Oscillospiraceae bacterium]MBQ9168970.1 DNA topoisomerase 3 [Oscillospiraceae bacterium]